ncbi:hypothetical protein BgAZ_108110 [Babesia gibsoni]|uniref:Uncharacterized protein n=1 Tax=Babesia gibsoni TaxID=33632 RepID=A0AAD8PGR0_BABGI|nr:hypothetical protein BgAZ_108110 [Babesia gibsoni]
MANRLLYYVKYSTGAFAILSLILPYCINFATFNVYVMRTILNFSWAFVFGSHVWYIFLSSDDFYFTGGNEGSFFRKKKKDLLLTYSPDDCTKFFISTLFFNTLIVITTCGLAPFYKWLQYCSVTSLLATFTNTFFVPKTEETDLEGQIFSRVSPATCSRTLSLITCVPLVTYSLL